MVMRVNNIQVSGVNVNLSGNRVTISSYNNRSGTPDAWHLTREDWETLCTIVLMFKAGDGR